jgi:hypothetical protein
MTVSTGRQTLPLAPSSSTRPSQSLSSVSHTSAVRRSSRGRHGLSTRPAEQTVTAEASQTPSPQVTLAPVKPSSVAPSQSLSSPSHPPLSLTAYVPARPSDPVVLEKAQAA